MVHQNIPPSEALHEISALLSEGRSCRIIVTGNSMLPFLRNNKDAVILSPIESPLHRSDIIFYKRSSVSCVLHRIIRVNKNGSFSVCGDAQKVLESVSRQQIIGVVTAIERNGRSFDRNNILWCLLSSIWIILMPIRPSMLHFAVKIKRIKKELP